MWHADRGRMNEGGAAIAASGRPLVGSYSPSMFPVLFLYQETRNMRDQTRTAQILGQNGRTK
eukprot:364322-Chlamydomonas_euryale.AAC.5